MTQPTPETVASSRLPGVEWVCKPRAGDPAKPKSEHNRQWHDDERVDPRIREFFRGHPFGVMGYDKLWLPLLDSDALAGGEELAPSAGLEISEDKIQSHPDGNTLTLSVMRPKRPGGQAAGAPLPCIVYCHGGGMSHYSAFLNCFQTLGRLIARRGIVCVLPDFRNSDVPSRVGEVAAPFPAGLNDCVSTVRWVHANAAALGVDVNRVVVAGESGGGNLAIATALRLRREEGGSAEKLLAGVFVACPFVRGVIDVNDPKYASLKENAGMALDLETNVPRFYRFYGHGEAAGMKLHDEKNVEAWPGYLTTADLTSGGFPPTAVVVNEFDPLRDEGIAFYDTCAAAGVEVRCTSLSGTTHGIGTMLPGICPDITHTVVDAMEAVARSKRAAC